MAQLTETLVRDILSGAGCTRWEIEQLCHAWIATTETNTAASGLGHIEILRFLLVQYKRQSGYTLERAALTAAIEALAAQPAPGVGDAEVLAALQEHVRQFGTQKEFALHGVHASEQYVSDVLSGRRLIPEKWVAPLGFVKTWLNVGNRAAMTEALSTRPAESVAQGGELLSRIGELIRTQDNRITSHPVFVVEQQRTIYAVDTDYDTDGFDWLDDEGVVESRLAARLEKLNQAGGDTGKYRRLGYKHYWEFVTACFTEQGCKDYLAANGHNLKNPRIYVYSAYRNAEWIALREILAATPTPATGSGGDQAIELLAEVLGVEVEIKRPCGTWPDGRECTKPTATKGLVSDGQASIPRQKATTPVRQPAPCKSKP